MTNLARPVLWFVENFLNTIGKQYAMNWDLIASAVKLPVCVVYLKQLPNNPFIGRQACKFQAKKSFSNSGKSAKTPTDKL